MSNLVEFALGLSPLTFDADQLPGITVGAGTISLSYLENTLLPGIVIRVESSPDLMVWTPVSTTSGTTTTYTQAHTATVSTTTDERLFLRITVEETQ